MPQVPHPPIGMLITDFDGTMTEKDFYKIALERFTPPAAQDIWQRYLRRELTVFETLRGIFATIQASQAEVVAALPEMLFDPGAAQAIARLRAAGWGVVITSAGCDWYIRRVFADAGIETMIHANPGEFVDGGGLAMRLAMGSPYMSPTVGIDKAAVVRDALAKYPLVAFAGDSVPDLAAARLVKDDLRFARHLLAEHLDRESLPYQRYQHWSEVADQLLARNA